MEREHRQRKRHKESWEGQRSLAPVVFENFIAKNLGADCICFGPAELKKKILADSWCCLCFIQVIWMSNASKPDWISQDLPAKFTQDSSLSVGVQLTKLRSEINCAKIIFMLFRVLKMYLFVFCLFLWDEFKKKILTKLAPEGVTWRHSVTYHECHLTGGERL